MLAGLRPRRAIRGGSGPGVQELIVRRVSLAAVHPGALVITGLRAPRRAGLRVGPVQSREGNLRAIGARPGRLAQRPG